MTAKAPKQKFKNLTRYEYKGVNAWWVRIRWQGKTLSKFFPDKKYGGSNQALLSAITWRDEAKKKHNIPITEKQCIGKANSSTGVVGVYWEEKHSRYSVRWVNADGSPGHTSVSLSRNGGKKKAFEKACAIRIEKEENRLLGLAPIKKKTGMYARVKSNFWSTEQLLQILIEKAQKLNRKPTSRDFVKTKPNKGNYETRFGSWKKAIKAAGLD